MHNDTATENKSILDRAIKARQRRDRDGKKQRPVTDALIEYAEELRDNLNISAAAVMEAESKIEVLRDVISKQSATIDSLEARIIAA